MSAAYALPHVTRFTAPDPGRRFNDFLAVGVLASALFHLGLLAFFPEVSIADVSRDNNEVVAIDVAPRAELPPPPDEILRPAIPLISTELDADISVTITQVMALRAARDSGIKVEKSVIDKAVKYVESLQNPDGGFNYMAGSGNNSAFPRSAAGVATLYYAGISEGKQIDAGLAYVERFTPGRGNQSETPHYYYGHYYAAQAMFLAGGDHWGKWYPAVREELIARQNPDGSWTGEVSPEYCTAMALIVLQMPNRYLPVFSGKGPGS